MKIVMDRAPLIRLLAKIDQVIEARNTIPILSTVLLSASLKSEVVTATGSDLDVEIVESAQAEVIDGGGACVGARTLFDVVRKMPEGCRITLAVEGGHMAISGGRARFRLPVLPVDDFPMLASVDLPTTFVLPAKALAKMIDSTRFAISTEETRYYLNGLYWHVMAEQFRCVATDGHRLALVGMAAPEGAEDMDGIIVPRKAVAVLRKLLDGAEGEAPVEISASDSKIRFHLGDAVLTSKLIDGSFPDYTRVIPPAVDAPLRIDPAALTQAAERVAVIAEGKARAVKLSLDKDKVTLSVTSPENGTATEEVPADHAGKAIDIGFNVAYLSAALSHVPGDVAELHIASADGPVLVRDRDGGDATFVVMPMRV